jgi:hypothetical protein
VEQRAGEPVTRAGRGARGAAASGGGRAQCDRRSVGTRASEIGNAGNVRALCAAKLALFESGSYDLSTNAEFVNLLKANP